MSETKAIPAHIRLLTAGYILMPNQSPAQREVEIKIAEALEDACWLLDLDVDDMCDELNNKHREGEAKVYAAAPELLEAEEKTLARISKVRELLAGWQSMSGTRQLEALVWLDGWEHEARTLISTVKGETNE